ncbi:hypothetical protein BBJ28_00006862 [Nothophytophthora sp. Chile5]|nr:hypothetical protein BBJ28_00006862 [Nothophytophthora sp. Chile5]
MYSDDSEASEVESEAERAFGDGDSDVASEIAESFDGGAARVNPKQQQLQQKEKVVEPSDAYDDDDFEEDGGYSVDFEADEAEQPAPRSSMRPASPTVKANAPPSPTRSITSNARRSALQSDEASAYDYDEASFEEESRRSLSRQSLSQSGRHAHVVDLSVRAARDSPPFRPAPASDSNTNDLLSGNLLLLSGPNSPKMDAKVLSKPAPATLPSVAEEEVEAAAAMQSKQFSLLLRKVESKFEDEVEELREKNALLAWKERELKAALRRAREELTMRKARIEKKRRRATERRREHERAAERVQQELEAARAAITERNRRMEEQQQQLSGLRGALQTVDHEKHEVEGRNLALAEKLQAALGDFHQLTRSFEDAVNAKLACEQRIQELKSAHHMELQVLEHKSRVDIEAATRSLEQEIAARTAERTTLPEIHQRIVDAEKERFEKLETALHKQMRDLETRTAQETLVHATELARATEAKHQAEQRAERRVQDELDRIARERDAVDEQRRELLASVTRTSARFDEERGKMEAKCSELDARRTELADERAELDARDQYVEQRARRLDEQESVVERRRTELAALGRETLERSRTLAQRGQEFADATAERDKLRELVRVLTERSERSENRAMGLEQDREKLEQAAHALQQERLLVAKQRVQSRYFLDGARKLESMLHQQHRAVESGKGEQRQPKRALYAPSTSSLAMSCQRGSNNQHER